MKPRRILRILPRILGLSFLLYLLLLIPEKEAPIPPSPAPEAFLWNQDDRWQGLERLFAEYRDRDCRELEGEIGDSLARLAKLVDRSAAEAEGPESPLYRELERSLFTLAPMVGACPDRAGEYLGLVSRMRSLVKARSAQWQMDDPGTRRRLYRLLYGSRAAVEEVLLQMPRTEVPALVRGDDEPSKTPSTTLLGVTIHSGDILLSRGGAPTSALIARGNDYQGNFSHVAIVYVDSATRVPSIIESHIERGVAVAGLDEYLQDVKLRVMVLRPREDLPALRADPLLPHRAAETALASARGRHIPYDFAMDGGDTSAMFCSEVVLAAYAVHGLSLWKRVSTISTPGIRSWLSGFGVRFFTTQEPSDLEYDPQLRVVAEWRDPETLLKDHVDNAVVEALLEGAERGESLGWSWPMLPFVRVLKAYSLLLNYLGRVGPVPEGMSATSALRHYWLVKRHAELREGVLRRVEEFRARKGYEPPYWQLLDMARKEHLERN